MAVSGTYYVKMWIPNPALVHGGGEEIPGKHEAPGGPRQPPAEKPRVLVELKDYGSPEKDFFEGEMTFHFTANPDGTLSGDADGTPIHCGYYTEDRYFKVDFSAGPGRWEIVAKIDEEGYIEGIISVGGGKGFPNLVYGKKLD